MREQPSLVKIIASLPCLDELDGAVAQVKAQSLWTTEVAEAAARRRAELSRSKSTK